MTVCANSRTLTPPQELPPNISGEELFRQGLLYASGQGGMPLNYISAHMLFDLAALRGCAEAKVWRNQLSEEMPPMDVDAAKHAMREWLSGN